MRASAACGAVLAEMAVLDAVYGPIAHTLFTEAMFCAVWWISIWNAAQYMVLFAVVAA